MTWQLFFEYAAISILLLLLPLVPSIIVYKISPKDKVGIGGVFHAFTINATGAFAAYLICLLVLYFFVLQGFMEQIKTENDHPSQISQYVLSNYPWAAEYTPLNKQLFTLKSNMRFEKSINDSISLKGITTCTNDKCFNVKVIEWKSEPFKINNLTNDFEIKASMKWLEGQLQFDTTNMKYEINKWINGKIKFKSDYFLRGEFVNDLDPLDKWGLWLSIPPK
jgi:hypothetical protein